MHLNTLFTTFPLLLTKLSALVKTIVTPLLECLNTYATIPPAIGTFTNLPILFNVADVTLIFFT